MRWATGPFADARHKRYADAKRKLCRAEGTPRVDVEAHLRDWETRMILWTVQEIVLALERARLFPKSAPADLTRAEKLAKELLDTIAAKKP